MVGRWRPPRRRDPYQCIDRHQLLSLQWLSQPLSYPGRPALRRARRRFLARAAGQAGRDRIERAILPFSERSEPRGTGGAAPGQRFAPARNIAGYLPDSLGCGENGRRSRAEGGHGRGRRSSGVARGVGAESFDARTFFVADGVGDRHGRRGACGLAPAHARCERLLRVEAPAAGAALRECAADWRSSGAPALRTRSAGCGGWRCGEQAPGRSALAALPLVRGRGRAGARRFAGSCSSPRRSWARRCAASARMASAVMRSTARTGTATRGTGGGRAGSQGHGGARRDPPPALSRGGCSPRRHSLSPPRAAAACQDRRSRRAERGQS
jgi:hypothetical protein